MNTADFINGLADAGMPFADDSPDYCPDHGWDLELYHEDGCLTYARQLERLREK